MEPDGGPEHRFALGQFGHAAVLFGAGAHVDDGHEAGGLGPVEDAQHVLGQAVEVDVGVAVDDRFGHLRSLEAPSKLGG